MARNFAATSDQLRIPLVTQMTGAFSVGAWVRRATAADFDSFYSRVTSASAANFAVQISTASKVSLEIVGSVPPEQVSTLEVKPADGWVFIGVDKASGSATPKCHVWRSSTLAWTHQNLGGAMSNAATAGASATIRLGEWTGGTVDNFNGDIEVVVEFNGTQLTDAQWEKAAFTRAGLLALTPTGLWELTQASVTEKVQDRSGNALNESVRAGTTVTVGSCPYYSTGPLVVGAMGSTLPPAGS